MLRHAARLRGDGEFEGHELPRQHRREVDRQRAGHYPTLDLVANYGESKTFASTALGLLDTQYQNIGLQIIPTISVIFSQKYLNLINLFPHIIIVLDFC